MSHVPPVVTWGAQDSAPTKGRKGNRTHGRKSKEGDTNEGECCCQEPPVPGLGVLVSVANGCQGYLQDSEPGHPPGLALAM